MTDQPGSLTCREVVELLWEYIDAELTPEMEHRIRTHLEACEGCYPHYDFQRAFVEFVRRHGTQATPPALRQRIFLALLEEEAIS
jgi:anti-sigma factor (TIGR02949 family)